MPLSQDRIDELLRRARSYQEIGAATTFLDLPDAISLLNEVQRLRILAEATETYREYYLSTEQGFELSDTVGVSTETWHAHESRMRAAEAACEELEAQLRSLNRR